MPIYFKPEKVARWKGTLDDIVSVVDSTAAEIASQTGQSPPFSARVQGPTMNAELTAANEMRSVIKVDDFKRLEKIDLIVGEWKEHTALGASITFSREQGKPAVEVETRGQNRIQVEGLLSATLKPFLEQGKRKINLSNTVLYFVSLALLLLLIFAFVSIPITYPDIPYTVLWLISSVVGAVIGVLVFASVYKFANWIYPELELLAPGDDTQFQKSRRWVFSVIGSAIVAPIIVGVLLAVLT
jgi:hypothetical protein